MTNKDRSGSPVVKKVLDGVARVVLGPREGRGVEPRDARELTEDADEQQEQRPGGDR